MADKRVMGALVALTSVAVVLLVFQRHDPVRALVDAAPRDSRAIEARLTGGFAWAPVQPTMRSADTGVTPQGVRLASAAWGLVKAANDDSSPEAQHAAAIAILLNGNARAAMARLTTLASAPVTRAALWSDLAAVRVTLAISENDPQLLADALAAADTALRLDPALDEALFNRAFILQQLGLRDHARRAWENYLAKDGDSDWANEARGRTATVALIQPFKAMLEARFEELAGDPTSARALARSDPQNSRRFGETWVLGRWADAEKANDSTGAEKNLRLAREFGDELARQHGEQMLQRAVAAIDNADATRRAQLVEGHIFFRDGQRLFKSDQIAEAQHKLDDAARAFATGGSPLALVAQYFVAHTYHGLGNLEEARAREERLLSTAPVEFPAHRASLLWHLGLGYQADGEGGRMIESLRESVTIFQRIGEVENESAVHGLIAEAFDRTGDPAAAWTQRVLSLKEIGKGSTDRLQMTLDSMGRGAILRKQWPVALSFLDLARDLAAHVGDPAIEVEMELLQARVHAAMHSAALASAAIARARQASSRLNDEAMRTDATADILATEAIVATQPQDSIALLTRAIDYHRTRGRKLRLPELLLNRSRAYAHEGNTESAAADAEAGIVEMERHRESLPSGEMRWGVFDGAEELFAHAIELSLQRGEVARAFAYSERARARSLLDTLGRSPTSASLTLAPDTVVIEYAELADRVVIFVADADAITVAPGTIDRAALAQDAAHFQEAVAKEDTDLRQASVPIRRKLIALIEPYLTGKQTIVFVPGPSLAELPFAAIADANGTFLIQQFTIVSSPSAAIYSRLAARVRPSSSDRHLVVLANPNTLEDLERLPMTEAEATECAASYAMSTKLIEARATTIEFQRSAPDANVIHMATHGVVPAGTRGRASLVLSDGRLDVTAIAAMSLPKTPAVVLAACSTARGATRAEGTISVARAFLAAGASSVAATLWPIDDRRAAAFFPLLHQHLSRGVTPSRALQRAQIDAIDQGMSPSIWAAVQCLGS